MRRDVVCTGTVPRKRDKKTKRNTTLSEVRMENEPERCGHRTNQDNGDVRPLFEFFCFRIPARAHRSTWLTKDSIQTEKRGDEIQALGLMNSAALRPDPPMTRQTTQSLPLRNVTLCNTRFGNNPLR